jgi:hypothetical protein
MTKGPVKRKSLVTFQEKDAVQLGRWGGMTFTSLV